LADDMGLGKTPQALAAIEKEGAFPGVVLCPATLRLNWKHEIQRWLPNRTVSVVRSSKTAPEKTDLVVIGYNLVSSHLKALRDRAFQSIVADESHYLKNRDAKRTVAAQSLSESVGGLRFCLSGTPFTTGPIDLVAQLEFLGRFDRDFGGFWPFVNRYCDPHTDRYGHRFDGASNLEELGDRLRSTCYCRREKASVLPQLPIKRHHQQWIELDDRSGYLKIERDVARRVDHIKAAMEEDAPASSGYHARAIQRRQELMRQALRLRRACGIHKIPSILEWLENFQTSGEPLVVFAYHRDVQDAIVDRFPKAAHVLAKDSVEERDAAINLFQKGADCRLLICSLRAASEGITLTRAADVAFAELDWVAATHQQAEARLHRIGQSRAVNAWYLIGEDSVDLRVMKALENRWNNASRVHTSIVDELFGADHESASATMAVVTASRSEA